MARNRKNEAAAVRLASVIKTLMLCVLIAGSAVGYVWYQNQIAMLGQQIKEREVRLTELRRKNKLAEAQLSALTSPVALDARVRELNRKMNLGLAAPPVSQIVRLIETPPAGTEIVVAPGDVRHAQANPRERGN